MFYPRKASVISGHAKRTLTSSPTAGQISLIQTRALTLYVYPDWPNRRVLVGGSVQYQAYQQYRLSHNLPAENPVAHHHLTGASGTARVERAR